MYLSRLRRTLLHHWRMSLAVTAGAAVAAAVLTGALLVGDSVRGSLRDLTRERLGGIDHALVSQQLFRAEVADTLAAQPSFDQRYTAVAPAILLRGSVEHASRRTRATQVGIQGVDERFLRLFAHGEEAEGLFPADHSGPFPPVVLNASLAAELGAAEGDDLLLHLKRWSAVPRGSLLGRKETGDVVRTLRLRVTGVLPDRGLGRFSLATHQTLQHNAFVPLAALARALDQEGRANSLFIAARQGETADAGPLADLLRNSLTAADLGLTFTVDNGYAALESDELVLRPEVARTAEQVGNQLEAPLFPLLTYLANDLRPADPSSEAAAIEETPYVPYATVAALPAAPAAPFGDLVDSEGRPLPVLADDEILLNTWAAEQLGAAAGDRVTMTYFEVGPREELREVEHDFEVAGQVAIQGLAADRSLVQDYPGIADADTMGEWDPPFPVDLGRVRPVDEDYWRQYRATPKAFVSLETGQELWRTRWGALTALRFGPAPGEDIATTAQRFGDGFLDALPLDTYGLIFQPLKAQGLAAAAGPTDFGQLFLSFSFFLIVSAALLAALLFRLGVEQRASEIGLLFAAGFPLRAVKRQLLAEGFVIAAIGALAGLCGAVAFAALMIAALRTWWRPAVGTSELALHVTPVSLVIGYVAAVAVILFSIWWTVRRVAKVPTTRLLAGQATPVETATQGRLARILVSVCLPPAFILLAFAISAGETQRPILFFTIGPLLLIGLLALLARFAARPNRMLVQPGAGALLRLAAGNSGRHRGRSILSATLVATACFMVVTVAAFQQNLGEKALGHDSGTGGYALVATAEIPLYQDLASTDGRAELGLQPATSDRLEAVQVTPFRFLPGDDTSCLNLYQPTQPRLLGVPPEQIDRGGFTFQKTLSDTDQPWTLLREDLGPGVIPAFGDANSAQWILKVGLGEELVMEDELGEEIRLRLVGLLATSIFQSELLIAEEAFQRHFPSHDGFAYFLIDAPEGETADLAEALESGLSPYGFDAVDAAEKLESFHVVQNTYLSTFQTLGGLGLLLGTVGLAVILIRNVLERRGELAAMRAFGFRARSLTYMVVAENTLLLFAGLVIGTVAALVTVAPHLLSAAAAVSWPTILGTLVAIFLAGLVVCTVAAAGALRTPLLEALRSDR